MRFKLRMICLTPSGVNDKRPQARGTGTTSVRLPHHKIPRFETVSGLQHIPLYGPKATHTVSIRAFFPGRSQTFQFSWICLYQILFVIYLPSLEAPEACPSLLPTTWHPTAAGPMVNG